MEFREIEASYERYLEIENQLTPEERLKFLKGYQELIKLFKLNTALEAVEEQCKKKRGLYIPSFFI